MQLTLTYPTHTIILQHDDGSYFTKLTNSVNTIIFNDMITSLILRDNNINNFVSQEMDILNGFLRSLLIKHENGISTMYATADTFVVFRDEMEYYVFCLVNNLQFESNEWFKTAYIKCDIYTTRDFIEKCSESLIKMTYPHLAKPKEKTVSRTATTHNIIFKCDPNKYQWFLEKYEIDKLYHFSPIENKESIKKHSICSYQYLIDNNISINRLSSSDTSRKIDKSKGLSNYVHLLFEPFNPMIFVALSEGRLREFTIYEIEPEVLFLKDTMYTIGNAALAGVRPKKDIQFLLTIPFSRFHKKNYTALDDESKKYFQSEILVKNKVDLKYIINLNCNYNEYN